MSQERLEKCELKIPRQSCQGSNAKYAPRRAVYRTEGADQFVTGSKNRIGMIEGNTTGFRQDKLPAASFKQRMSELRLEFLNLNGQCRLRNAEQLRCAGKIALVSDGPEVTQVMIIQPVHKNIL